MLIEEEAEERRRQRASKETKEGNGTRVAFKEERKRKATPPPRPVSRDWWNREKFEGVKLLRIEGGVSEESQVSERERRSRLLSRMNS